MRPVEADPEEEGLALAAEPLEQLDRARGNEAVRVFPVLPFVVGEPAQRAAELPRHQGEHPVEDLSIAPARVDGEVPRLVVVEAAGPDVEWHAVVEQLADAGRHVAVGAKRLRQRHRVGQPFPEVRGHRVAPGVGEYPCRVRTTSGQQGRPAGTAQRILRVRALEPDASRCQRVDVGRARRPSVTGEVRVQVVRHDQQHVQPRRRGSRGGLRGERGGGQHAGAEDQGGPKGRAHAAGVTGRCRHGVVHADDITAASF